MDRLTDDQLRELLDEARRDSGFEFAIDTNALRAIVEELLERRRIMSGGIPSDYWEKVESSAKKVREWPDWKTGRPAK